MTVSGGISINGLIQGLPQGQIVIAQTTLPASGEQPQFVSNVPITTATAFAPNGTPGGVYIINSYTGANSLFLSNSSNQQGPQILNGGYALISWASSASLYLVATTGTVTGVQVIFF